MGELEPGLPLGEGLPMRESRNPVPPKPIRRRSPAPRACTDGYFIERIAEATGLPQGEAIIVYHLILDAMKHALRRHREAIRIRGFGTLERVTRQGHRIKHPRTGEDAVSRSFNYVRFRAAPTLKQTIREA